MRTEEDFYFYQNNPFIEQNIPISIKEALPNGEKAVDVKFVGLNHEDYVQDLVRIIVATDASNIYISDAYIPSDTKIELEFYPLDLSSDSNILEMEYIDQSADKIDIGVLYENGEYLMITFDSNNTYENSRLIQPIIIESETIEYTIEDFNDELTSLENSYDFDYMYDDITFDTTIDITSLKEVPLIRTVYYKED
jgi:hypothetical protein